MTLIERARALLKPSSGATLVAVPLALAVSGGAAEAAVQLPTSAIQEDDPIGYIDHVDIHGGLLPGGGTAFLGGSPAFKFSSGGYGSIFQEGLLNESFDGHIDLAYSFTMSWYDYGDYSPITIPANWLVVLSVSQTGGGTYKLPLLSSNGVYQGTASLTGVHLDAGKLTQVSFASASYGSNGAWVNLGNGGYVNFTPVADVATSPVPEPQTWALFGAGLLALMARRRRA